PKAKPTSCSAISATAPCNASRLLRMGKCDRWARLRSGKRPSVSRSCQSRETEDESRTKETIVTNNVRRMARGTILALLVGGLGWWASAAQSTKLDAAKIGKAAGSKATTTPDGVVRLGWARTDVAVTVDGMAFKPAAGLGSWAAFTPVKHGAMVMGDTVVFQDEVTPAMDAAFAGGLEVTGLHNHFFFDEPKVYFMHIGGHGDPEKLARAVKDM